MGLKPALKRYETRNQTAGREVPSCKSRVDWRRTRRALKLIDSNDESSATSEEEEEEESTTSESETDEKDQTHVKNGLSNQEKDRSGEVTEDGDDECVVPGKRKSRSTSVLCDSDDSEDSDILVRKVSAKRRCIVDDDEIPEERQPDKTCPTENVSASRKQKMLAKLKELVRQNAARRSCSSTHCEVRGLSLKFNWRKLLM